MSSPEEDQKPKTKLVDNQTLEKIAYKLWEYFVKYRLLFLVGALAFWVKIVYTASIDMWDEGWFVSIASRIADGLSDPFTPLYYRGNDTQLQLFDKPPFSFIFGALLMNIFGKSSFAANGMNAIGGAGLAVVVYLLFSHQKENQSAHVIAGLLIALASFLTFYSRTAYIDPFVIFMGSIVLLAGVRAIDAIFVDNDLRKGYLLIILTGILNVLNIMTKAWQGILIGPSLALYLIFRYMERHVDFTKLKPTLHAIQNSFSLTFSESNEEKESSQKNNIIAFPYIVFLVTLIISFLFNFIFTQLLFASLIIASASAGTIYSVFLHFWKDKLVKETYIELLLSILGSIFASFTGIIFVSVFYKRLEGAFIEFGTELSTNNMSIIDGIYPIIKVFLFFLPSEVLGQIESLENEFFTLALLEIIAASLGAVFAILVGLIAFGVLLDYISTDRVFVRFLYELIDSIPLIIMGVWLLFWFVGILLMGHIFDRDAAQITLFGIAISLLLIPLLSYYPQFKNYLIETYNLKARLRSRLELSIFSSHILFIGITVIIIILSFYPFIAWIQYMDINLINGDFPWPLRTPGELAGDPNRPGGPNNPDTILTYAFLFFEYYIGWRYAYGTKYSLARSVGGAINDYALLVMLPFFIIGLWAFFFSERRNPALGSALIAWLLVVPLVFFPAMFQLNYYYIPLVIPYFAIAAKGAGYIYSSKQMRLLAVDNVEKGLAGGYFFFEIGWTFILYPIFYESVSIGRLSEHLFVASIYLLPFAFLCFYVLKTFPGIITAGFAYKYFIDQWFRGGSGLYKLYDLIFHDLFDTLLNFDSSWITDVMELGAPLATFVGLIILIVALYWLQPKIKPQLTIILALILSGMLLNVSVNAHYSQIFDLRYQEMAIYINNHGGDYNYSTWAIHETGTQFALRYYLEYEVLNTGNYPFSSNSSSTVHTYFTNSRPNITFWVIVNHTGHWWDAEKGTGVPPYAEMYPGAYKWFRENPNLVCVDEIVGLTTWFKMHLFVNKTRITEQGYNWKTLSGK